MHILRKILTAKYLDVLLRPSKILEVTIVERPGLWMEKTALNALIGECQAVVTSSLPAPLDYGIFAESSAA
jgi:hypothetical protein